MMNTQSPYHLMSISPWPILSSLSGSILLAGFVSLFQNNSLTTSMIGLIMIELTKLGWWTSVIEEETFEGNFTSNVIKSSQLGVILFIISEVMFFFAFFWAFFHSALSPSIEIGSVWPPMGLTTMNPFAVPLLNTAILLASGVTITWSHHNLMYGDKKNAFKSLAITIFLAIYFLELQLMEYSISPFSISDSVYGATFFVMTGFHGFHVALGTTLLIICLKRIKNNHYSNNHLFGFEATAWYWHFVDVVWIFLYLCIYWWPS